MLIRTNLWICIRLILASLVLSSHELHAQSTAFNYNGSFNDGTTPAVGNYDLAFTLFDAFTNGTSFGSVTNSGTMITNGLFSVTLDFGNVFNGSNYWLELAVRTNGTSLFTTLNPRQPITPTPYAIYSAYSGTASSANSVAGSNIIGTVSLTHVSAAVVTNLQSGLTLGGGFAGLFTGNGAGLTNVPVAGLSGTLADSQLSTNVAQLNQANIFANPSNVFNGTFNGNGIGLTNLAVTGLSGTLPDSQLSANVAQLNQANIFANPSNVFNGTFNGNGIGLTNLAVTGLSGTLADSQLSANVALLDQADTFANPSNVFNGTFSGNGAGLTNLAVTDLSGTLADSQLSTNVALLDHADTFANPSNVFNGTFHGNGIGLTNLAVTGLSGTLADSQLSTISTNIALLDQANTFNNPNNSFAGSFAGNGAALTNLNANNLTAIITNVLRFENGNNPNYTTTNLIIGGTNAFMLMDNCYAQIPVATIRPLLPSNVSNSASAIALDICPNGPAITGTWLDIGNTDWYTNSGAARSGGNWLHLAIDSVGIAHIDNYFGTNGTVKNTYISENGGNVSIGTAGGTVSIGIPKGGTEQLGGTNSLITIGTDLSVYPFHKGSGEIPTGDFLLDSYTNFNFGIDQNQAEMSFYYMDSTGHRAAISYTNNFGAIYGMLNLMPSGGTVLVGGNIIVTNASQINVATNYANTYAVTNDPTPGAWNTGPNARFTVTVPEYATLSAAVATSFLITISNADWYTPGTYKPQFSTFGSAEPPNLLTPTITNYISTVVIAPNSLWTATNLVNGNSISVAGVNGTLVNSQ